MGICICLSTRRFHNVISHYFYFSGECIDINDLCNGMKDCVDGSDENISNCDQSEDLEIRLVDPHALPSDFTSFTAKPVKRGRVEIKHNVRYLFWYHFHALCRL